MGRQTEIFLFISLTVPAPSNIFIPISTLTFDAHSRHNSLQFSVRFPAILCTTELDKIDTRPNLTITDLYYLKNTLDLHD